MVDKFARVPNGIELDLVHHFSVREWTFRDEQLENMQSDGRGGSVENVRGKAFIGSLQEGPLDSAMTPV
jgi:hypothetical protein